MLTAKTNIIENIPAMLQNKGISPSIQRIKIFEVILKNRVHSSADYIYRELVHEIPTLSKTTVYNTLALFVEKGLINSFSVDSTELLYEHSNKPHAHFQCEICKEIFDMDFNSAIFNMKEIEGNMVNNVHIIFRGTCKNCKTKIKNK